MEPGDLPEPGPGLVGARRLSEPRVLVVAGLDPSGGAGLLADADAIRAAGGRPLLCAAAITIQTTRAVRGFHALPGEVVLSQIRALAEEEGPIAAVKLGMLGSLEVARALAARAASGPLAGIPWVVDPVLRSSSGADLVEGGAAAYEGLLAAGAVLTPNLPEAAALTGGPLPRTEEEMAAAGRRILAMGARAVVVKGGHLEGEAFDLLVLPGGRIRMEGPRLGVDRRGTGCRLASFLAASLARGVPLEGAVRASKEAVAHYLREGKLPPPLPSA